jgi:hypothetical protein
MEKLRLWHYTTIIALDKIIESGSINLANKSIALNEKPAVWFSSNPEWEHTVFKAMINHSSGEITDLTRDELQAKFGLARIEIQVTTNIITWAKFKRTSNINKDMAKALEKVVNDNGAKPEEWYACYDPIYSNRFIVCEVLINGKWVTFDPTKHIMKHHLNQN